MAWGNAKQLTPPSGKISGPIAMVTPPEDGYSFRIYVTGDTVRSQRTIAALRAMCDANLAGRYALEIIDVADQPQLTEEAGIIATPTVVRLAPPPTLRVIGDLSDYSLAARALGLPQEQASSDGGSS
ncbi:MAG: circadian clock KaiB family protein [Actinomycetota bacterium]|nr:circadian clock KaiB family protein [Actinomycetota bacterium]